MMFTLELGHNLVRTLHVINLCYSNESSFLLLPSTCPFPLSPPFSLPLPPFLPSPPSLPFLSFPLPLPPFLPSPPPFLSFPLPLPPFFPSPPPFLSFPLPLPPFPLLPSPSLSSYRTNPDAWYRLRVKNTIIQKNLDYVNLHQKRAPNLEICPSGSLRSLK